MSTAFPEGLVKYGETPVFTDQTVPAKLTSEHNTKAGVWGKLTVLKGALDYVVPGAPEKSARLKQGEFGVIEPTVTHYVRLGEETSFQVEFYKVEK